MRAMRGGRQRKMRQDGMSLDACKIKDRALGYGLQPRIAGSTWNENKRDMAAKIAESGGRSY
ncbi:hypothetical protein SERLA73DRAFT_133173 [Serpula lacrymans var. lacrymans S7.3]|uniref:Uncharacterized protein n=1 Tax=Serpula lacrymans var. lacrymans (strain S7.3) TaxID=936435 RepID=F8PQK4_SERL3|nr:hypothetical protein SERLA73DRAFT_133173 [Serpula lacrymans var. lacrymans S7.3]